ncbi:MAG TPA: hypothetical protein VFL80_08965 [Thermoanaerobaculia bacterium]|nr:hypothetical protein [Thermoanaerobaculia bacterium]
MSVSEELTAASVISMIESGAYPPHAVETIARGFLPLHQDDLISVLVYLAGSQGGETAALARTSLAELPARALLNYTSNPNVDSEHLARVARAVDNPFLLEALIRNRAFPDSAVAELARRAETHVQEVIVINHARILRTPEILDMLLENPALSNDVRRRVMETREEFFEKRARLAQPVPDDLEPEEDPEIPLDAIADLLEKAQEMPEAAPPLPEPDEDSTRAAWSKLSFMSISQKVKLAYRGDRTMRMFLVKERNRLICTAVMRNPRMTELEVEAIAGMRNVEEEVLRLIGMRRDWSSKYNIMVTLCKNPKAPVGVVLPFVNRLTLRDLKGLKDDRGVSQVIRETAKRLYTAKTQKSG